MLPTFSQKVWSKLISFSFAFLLGVKIHHLFWKSSENPASGPLSYVPAIGCDEIQETFLGTLSPITGGFVTENAAFYAYTGVEWNFDLGPINFTPSFAPGLYGEGNGKDLGHLVEFKSEIQVSLNLFENSQLGMSYNHISNASLGDKNPGANSYMFNFLQKF